MSTSRTDHFYRTPNELQRTKIPLKRVLVIGSCLVAGMPEAIRHSDPGCHVDYITFNNVLELPARPPSAVEHYDFQVLQIALRSLIPDNAYLRLPYADEPAHAALLAQAKERLVMSLSAILRYSREAGMLTFISNFLVPQTNPFGRLLPRYDLRNPVYLIETLNQFLDAEIHAIPNVHIFDVDAIAATFGKRYIQDDAVWQINHASALSNADFESDCGRLEPVQPATEAYGLKTWEFALATWAEIVAMYRTIMKVDTVKVVITDLDDTLWRGILAEEGKRSVEGWPLGLAEALLFIKRRGVIIAIASKNDAQFIDREFDAVFGASRLKLEDFAIRKIGWASKVQSVAEIVRQINVLPDSVVFIDDNPVERAAILEAFPSIRVMGEDLYSSRRILLWAPETQVANLTMESGKRSEMVTAQIERDNSRKSVSREAFLISLNASVLVVRINDMSHPSFPRAAELVSKSNQFNTTARRWTHQEWVTGFARGMRVLAFEVEDRFTEYGLVIVAIVEGETIVQFVMSCRVIGLGIEGAAIAEINRDMSRAGAVNIRGLYKASGSNDLCGDLFEKAGFQLKGDEWVKAAEPCAEGPAHVRIVGVPIDDIVTA